MLKEKRLVTREGKKHRKLKGRTAKTSVTVDSPVEAGDASRLKQQ